MNYENREKAMESASQIFGMPAEYLNSLVPQAVLYEFPISKTLDVYKVTENVGFGITWTRCNQGSVEYGLWIVSEDDVVRVTEKNFAKLCKELYGLCPQWDSLV
jgi:hypothetical protein